MTTFDQILPITAEVIAAHRDKIEHLDWLLVNRDLNGRVRFIAPEHCGADDAQRTAIEGMYRALAERIAPHAYPAEQGILYEATFEDAIHGARPFGFINNTWAVDRLANESAWESIAEVAGGVPRIVFYSIKGGVVHSRALAATVWWLAQADKRVLVLDLDLESPGLSSSLLPPERQPKHGITDWLVEDLVGNGGAVLKGMVANIDDVFVAPAHGDDFGEYVSKFGRIRMPKVRRDGQREQWSSRLNRMIDDLIEDIRPDVVLINSSSGIGEIASACVTDLGAHTVYLFDHTSYGYHIVVSHWWGCGVYGQIRNRIQIVNFNAE